MAFSARSIVFKTGEPACAVDRLGRIVAWNSAAAETFGYPESAALQTACWQLLRGRDPFGNRYCGKWCPQRDMVLRGEPVRRCELTFTLGDGSARGFSVSTLSLHDRDGDRLLVHLCHAEPARVGAGTGAQFADRSPGARGDPILTPREHEALAHLAEGKSTRDIAVLMHISSATVRNHLEHLRRKLGAHSRLEAVAIGQRLGLV